MLPVQVPAAESAAVPVSVQASVVVVAQEPGLVVVRGLERAAVSVSVLVVVQEPEQVVVSASVLVLPDTGERSSPTAY